MLDAYSPLSAYNGMSAFEVAQRAFSEHKSQQKYSYRPTKKTSGMYDMRRFGLTFTSVGQDTDSDMFEHMDYEDPEHNDELVDTRLGEWAYRMFDTVPVQGDSFRYHDLIITAFEMDGARILTLKITREPAAAEGGQES